MLIKEKVDGLFQEFNLVPLEKKKDKKVARDRILRGIKNSLKDLNKFGVKFGDKLLEVMPA